MRGFTVSTIVIFVLSILIFSYVFLFLDVNENTVTDEENIENLIASQNSDESETNYYLKTSGLIDHLESDSSTYTITLIGNNQLSYNIEMPVDSEIILRQCNPAFHCPNFSSFQGEQIINNSYIFRPLDSSLIEEGDYLDIFITRKDDSEIVSTFITRYKEILNE